MEGNTSGPGNPSSSRGTENTFENLYPSLLQCFSVILVGYCVGRVGYISPTSSKGIGVFVGVVSLPALIFKSLVEIDYLKVNWSFFVQYSNCQRDGIFICGAVYVVACSTNELWESWLVRNLVQSVE